MTMTSIPPRRPTTLALFLASVSALPTNANADNPIVQTLYTADPAPMVYEDTLYLYTTHDEDATVNDFFTMNDWRVYSSKDVVNWTDHGSPLHYDDFAWAGGSAWAGQVIPRNDKFYFYVPVVRGDGSNAIGVAPNYSPLGPFQDAIGAPLITSDCGDIDPTVFIDDDGQAYLYWGNPNLCYVKLNEDMLSYQGSVVRVPLSTDGFGVRSNSDRATAYEEGPWFYKRDGRYYLVYPGGPLPEHIAYSTSTSPTGPWTYQHVIMPAEGGSFTNHPGVVDFGGKSFFFYHNAALPGGGGFKRSTSAPEPHRLPPGSLLGRAAA
jgi:beta-xylosidase